MKPIDSLDELSEYIQQLLKVLNDPLIPQQQKELTYQQFDKAMQLKMLLTPPLKRIIPLQEDVCDE